MIPAARRRLMVLYVVVAALLISLGGRLWYLQVMTGGSYANAAAQDQTRAVIVPSVRGGILDDVGQPLINNKTSLVVSVNRALVAQQPDGGLAELHRLAKLLHMDYGLLQQRLRLCTRRRVPAVLAGLPLPADPGGPAGVRRRCPPDHGEPARVPRGDRAGAAGDPVPAAVRHGRRPDTRVPAAHHPAGGRPAPSAGDRLLGRGPGGAGRAGGAVRPAVARDAGQAGAAGQRGRTGDLDPPADPGGARRHARDQHQRPATAGHAERTGAGHQPRAGRGQLGRDHRRGGRDDHPGAGGRDGQLSDL